MLVTGAGGMIGDYLIPTFHPDEMMLTTRQTLDVTDHRAVSRLIRELRPQVVLHLAAQTNVDLCQQQPDMAFQVNAMGVQNVALACRSVDAVMVYISTAGVFDGEKTEPYTEYDIPAPVNTYAYAKWQGEIAVQTFVLRHFIVRAGWMMGGGVKDKKFVGVIARLCRERSQLRVVHDTFGNPTYCKDFVEVLRRLIETEQYGIYDLVNSGGASRYEIAMEIVDYLDAKVQVIPVSSAEFPLPAPRPRSEVVRNFKLEMLGLDTMRPWREALRDYLGSWLGRS